MEKEIALSVHQLSKAYQKNDSEKIYAIDKLSFNLHKGEILGIIGRNGAGKSTLLKVLSQITQPSSGRIEFEGTLTSIIEIGTGFHPDLSGKENVFLSGSLLGQSKKEINALYDGIVAFSELQEFMEMPVKNYSSGMYLRLAFSVAFYSKIDILLLDEVIAVGDASFRRKCYQKIRDLKDSGAAIILVSHSMESIIEFCDTCLWLDKGKEQSYGKPLDIVEQYQEGINHQSLQNDLKVLSKKPGQFKPFSNEFISIEQIVVKAFGKNFDAPIFIEDEIEVQLHCKKQVDAHSLEIVYSISNMNDVKILIDSFGLRKDYSPKPLEKGNYIICCKIPGDLLNRGLYNIGLIVGKDTEFILELPFIAQFKIQADSTAYDMQIGSVIRPKLEWSIEKN